MVGSVDRRRNRGNARRSAKVAWRRNATCARDLQDGRRSGIGPGDLRQRAVDRVGYAPRLSPIRKAR